MPAKQALRWMARASPVFAGSPAPTGIAQDFQRQVPVPATTKSIPTTPFCLSRPTRPQVPVYLHLRKPD
ncbi:hypothetical protein CXG45_11295 [Pseudomonas plecoglossicida]|uniref:Uncharacterized protein n=1 Tax=Pseudomonas plecoglossicida TaxID=70775 RepID=A0ABX4TZ73_PSEDL|nr:hypothetical protein CXG44_08325 [Pseudomonas plecoglossicida]PLU93109.1 hypothetical protein CXG45_11295 [Pseudomonas plecoglossicida]PLV04281.1 hypothetical protein CXG48_10920 [Pseudomonas plecoglossicida]PLV13533.1 hypothetical protein CXG47_14720 [Pseudomonas plecoglossicida]